MGYKGWGAECPPPRRPPPHAPVAAIAQVDADRMQQMTLIEGQPASTASGVLAPQPEKESKGSGRLPVLPMPPDP